MGIGRYASMPHHAIFSAEICLDGAKFSHPDSGFGVTIPHFAQPRRRQNHRNRRPGSALIRPTGVE
jgi:hypothetical protein